LCFSKMIFVSKIFVLSKLLFFTIVSDMVVRRGKAKKGTFALFAFDILCFFFSDNKKLQKPHMEKSKKEFIHNYFFFFLPW